MSQASRSPEVQQQGTFTLVLESHSSEEYSSLSDKPLSVLLCALGGLNPDPFGVLDRAPLPDVCTRLVAIIWVKTIVLHAITNKISTSVESTTFVKSVASYLRMKRQDV